MTKERKEKDKPRTPWRDNIEAITMAVIMALVLKYFLIEAYKIPTGSMQPTLMGNSETGIFDRILVNKLDYVLRDPRRHEVVVFRYPLDRSKNFVKRLWGIGPEELRIQYGDVWHRPDASEPWSIVRRSQPVLEETWKRIDLEEPRTTSWARVAGSQGSWEIEGREILADGPGSARFRPDSDSILDTYTDGYPDAMRPSVRPSQRDRANPVGDLRLAAEVEPDESCEEVVFELTEGTASSGTLRRYVFRFPGPAAPEDARPRIDVIASGAGGEPTLSIEAPPYRMRAGRSVELAAQNIDDLLALEIDGDLVCIQEVDPAADQTSTVQIHLVGGGALLEDLQVYRDIYYIATHSGREEWTIPAGEYFMLGDNTQDSSDSREWRLVRYGERTEEGSDGDARTYQGNARLPENPVTPAGRSDEIWLVDEWGERYLLHRDEVGNPSFHDLPTVPREMIQGRALAVFWPMKPGMGIYRLKWIH